jgi:hypothetical protein
VAGLDDARAATMTSLLRSSKRYMPAVLRRAIAGVRFTARKYLLGYKVPTAPHLDELGGLLFRDVLSRTTRYLEYGTGGSTVLAWESAAVVVAVESDSRALTAVRRALSAANRRPALSKLIHADIGITRGWGAPLFARPTPARLARWENYAMAPWDFFRQHAIAPDTILIDGRFRVACALACLQNLEARSPCLLLFDDYGDRPHYRAVEEFADLVSTHGRMAVFRKKAAFDDESCRRVLQACYHDWR